MNKITITKEMIEKAITKAEIFIQDLDGTNVMNMRLGVEHSDCDIDIRFDVNSNNAIDKDSIIEKMENLRNLKWKMMSNLISSHTVKIDRVAYPLIDLFICIYDEDDLIFEPDAMELLEQTADSLNTTLNDAIEESIKQYFE